MRKRAKSQGNRKTTEVDQRESVRLSSAMSSQGRQSQGYKGKTSTIGQMLEKKKMRDENKSIETGQIEMM